MRSGLVAVYAVSRLGDDLADEQGVVNNVDLDDHVHGLSKRLEGLDLLDAVVSGSHPHEHHPVYWAVQDTIVSHQLPSAPFHRLFEAFRRDATAPAHFTTWDQVIEYCSYSANPVGELMLRLSGDWTDKAAPLSDALCTALQITNFLQDLHVDLQRGRRYIPGMPSSPHEHLADATAALQTARSITSSMYSTCSGIVKVPRSLRLRLELTAIRWGGKRMLSKCDQRIFTSRPTLAR